MTSSLTQFFRHSKGLWLFRCVSNLKSIFSLLCFRTFVAQWLTSRIPKMMIGVLNICFRTFPLVAQWLRMVFALCWAMIESVAVHLQKNNLWKQFCCNKIFEATTNCTLFQSVTSGSFYLNSKLQNIHRRKNRQDNAHLSFPPPRNCFLSTHC